MFNVKRFFFLILVVIAISCINTHVTYANPLPPPSIMIIVPNAPNDLEISLESQKARRIDKPFESHFTLYRSNLKSTDNRLKVTTGGSTFEITADTPLDSYYSVFTLDLERQTLKPGKSLLRSFSLISLMIVLTLIIEAIVFFLFGFRRKRSWLIFLIVNLITQGVLNIFISLGSTPINGYIIYKLIGGEFLVFIIEMTAFLTLVKEHGRLRTGLYVIAANLLSLIAGGYLIMVLPV
jgi:hypothetical protein